MVRRVSGNQKRPKRGRTGGRPSAGFDEHRPAEGSPSRQRMVRRVSGNQKHLKRRRRGGRPSAGFAEHRPAGGDVPPPNKTAGLAGQRPAGGAPPPQIKKGPSPAGGGALHK